MAKLAVTLVLLAFGASIQLASSADPEYTNILKLKNGKVRGVLQDAENGKKVEFYEGIRYGHAGRFEKPKPIAPWTNVYNATSQGSACPQFGIPDISGMKGLMSNLTFSEDCLYLNVWKSAEQKDKRAVMVWIHGGAFEIGTIFNSFSDYRHFVLDGDVIIVELNYRLGPLGFINGGGVTPNLGLHDQILALKWVNENIQHFGGDPKKITIFGGSAGSISVGALILSPLTKGLFQRAIMQSGAPTGHAVTEPLNSSKARTQIYAKKLHCPIDAKLEETIHCIRNKTMKQLQDATVNDFVQNHFFIPVYGDEVLPIRPTVALTTGNFNHVDLIYGVTRDEGTGFVANIVPGLGKEITSLTTETAKNDITFLMNLFHQSAIGKEVADFYVNKLHNASQDDFKIAISNAFGDYLLVCPSILFGEEFAKNSPMSSRIYAYRFMQEVVVPGFNRPKWFGVQHGADGLFLLMPQLLKSNPPLYKLSLGMIQDWTLFAKTGKPSAHWQEAFDRNIYDFSTRYLHLEASHNKMVSGYFKENCDTFWKPKMIA